MDGCLTNGQLSKESSKKKEKGKKGKNDESHKKYENMRMN